MLKKIYGHLRHHARFYIFGSVGILAWVLAETFIHIPAPDIAIAGDVFFTLYLILALIFVAELTPAHLRKRAEFDDEGILLISLITIGTIALSFVSIFIMINSDETLSGWTLALCVLSVPLGWLMLHAVMAFHYAHLYYTDDHVGGKKSKECGGLDFPNTATPDMWDFLYFAYVIGMTASVSDVPITMSHVRRFTLGHSILSFLYNTAILAFAVNIAAGLTN